MKFLKRKSQRDDQSSEEAFVVVPPVLRDPSPNPGPVAKDLPPPPLYARFARVTATPSFDSLNATLESPSVARFSAYNGSTASGFGDIPPSLRTLSSDGAGIGSQGRAAGSAFLRAGDSSASSNIAPATTKPEPIKLKQRGRRLAADSSATRVVSMVESRSNDSGPSPPTKPVRAWTNGSADTPNRNGVGSVPKPSFEDRLAVNDTATLSTKFPAGAMAPRGQLCTKRLAISERPHADLHYLPSPSVSAAPNSLSALSTNDNLNTGRLKPLLSPGVTSVQELGKICPTPLTISTAANGQTPTITPVPKRSSTAPNNRSSILGNQPSTLQRSILAPEDDPTDLFSFYNAAVRMTESPAPPSPTRARDGPPIAIHNRQSPSKSAYATSSANPLPISLNDSNDGDILVKPPSRRESLPQVARALAEAPKPSVAPNAPAQRSPSPVKPRPQPAQAPSSEPQGFSGMAGVGALGRNSVSSAAAVIPLPAAAPVAVATKSPSSNSIPTGSTAINGRYTASPLTLTPVASSDKIAFPKENAPIIPQYSHSIPEKTPLTKVPSNPASIKPVTPSSVLTSANTTPRVSTIPMPSSAASSVSTVRQSRIQAKANSSTPTPATSSKPTETLNMYSPVIIPNKAVERTPVPNVSPPAPQPQQRSTTPSRQSSSASVSSSSGPSATQSRSTATSPSGLNTPDDLPLARTPEPQEVAKIKLTKKSTVINGVTYNHDSDITPPATASPQPQRVTNATPGPVAAAIHQIQSRNEVTEQPRSPPYVRREKSQHNGYEEHVERGRYSKPTIQAPPVEQEYAPVAVPRVNEHVTSFYNTATATVIHDMEQSRGRESPAGNHARRSRYEPTPEPELDYDPDLIYPIEQHLSHPELLLSLLYFMQFPEVLSLSSVSKVIRNMLEDRRELREEVLERFLGTVGYTRWDFGKKREPLVLTLRDLNSYLRGVSIPIHRYAEIAEGQTFSGKESGKSRIVRLLASSTRAYSKVVLRLRVQAEMEAIMSQASPMVAPAKSSKSRPTSPLVRAQSPPPTTGTWQKVFHSPLYRIGHAPLLRVFVPSPDGAWLSDTSVLACEKELKRAGIVPLMKVGDVVWDTAVSDEAGFGNVGRLIWDGNYLIDLDYTFSTTGDIPPYLHSLSFPPAYFHKVLRSSGNPVMQLDLRPWGREIASNLQLVQDRAQAETPQGGRHNVMRWTHRTRLQVIRGSPIPDTNMLVDAGWEGAIVIEAEGTNEGLADLQLRCGMEWFKPQPGVQPKQGDGGRVFRLMRERSRPGEIWLRTVRMKERIS